MVSPLWKAASDGDVQKILELLNEPSAVDIEIKDHVGVTPLIEAVRNVHVEAVRVLLEKGANPSNPSSQGPPESYTSDPAILELLQTARNKAAQNENATHQPAYNEQGDHPEKPFYAPPQPDAYTYYPTINPSLSTVNESAVYYPPSQPQPPADGSPNGLGNLPPPEIARLIPCRYFPACRYGAQCMFAHPQTPYFQGPLPPVPYPPYDSMGHQYVPQFYPSPPNFQPPPPPPNGHPMSPPPAPPVMHTRTPSEVVSPSLGQFSPNGGPPPVPYGPLSPPVYPHPGQVPVGIQPIPPLPPLHPHAPHPAPPSHPNLYNPSSVPPYPAPQDAATAPYPLPVPPPNANYPDVSGTRPPDQPQAENFSPPANPREGGNGHRRGSGRRPSFGARKPPCLFFPSGRCKNGDDCRFPHVLPENAGTPTHPSFAPPRGGAPRARSHVNGPNGLGNLESKLGNMSIRDESSRQKNGVEGSSRSHSSDAGSRPKFQQGSKQSNGINGNKKVAPFKSQPQQRVPRADEFPVLGGTVTPPRVNGTGHNGPTAAQVLQAPPPARKEGSKESSTRGPSPDLTRGNTAKEAKPEANGTAQENSTPAQGQHITNNVAKLPAMSFAAAAAAAGGATTDVSKEVSVSA